MSKILITEELLLREGFSRPIISFEKKYSKGRFLSIGKDDDGTWMVGFRNVFVGNGVPDDFVWLKSKVRYWEELKLLIEFLTY